ncbi:MAG: RNA polymerase subunit sigma-70, partial [Undibacterium sp.]|nr:RNA polymerase subunit sigma-70 [Opitutaceae bacterium]
HARSRRSALARDSLYAADSALAPHSADDERALCRCFAPLLATLKPQQAALLRLVELEGHSLSDAALALGLTANHASVILHRARARLRDALLAFCGACAAGACLDCDC